MVAGTHGSLNKAGSKKMTEISTTAGIDTSKAKLDVALHGRAEHWQIDNTSVGWRRLAADLSRVGVTRVGIEASGGYESGVLSSLVNPANRVWGVSAGLTQPIFHGGALRGQLAFSKARYTELLTTYHKTVLTALSNVESALVAAGQTAEQETRQADAVAKAQRAYEFAQAQMAAGTINILTVLNTENALFSAKDTLVQVQYLHLQALVDLYTAIGGGWRQGNQT